MTHSAAASTSWSPLHPTDPVTTLASLRHGPGDPTFTVVGRDVWRGTMTDAGPASIRIRADGEGSLRADAWGEGARAAIDAAPAMLGGHDDPTGFEPRLDSVAAAQRRFAGMRLPWTGRVVESLVPAIIEQKVTGREAFGAYRRLVRRFGHPAPGPAPAGLAVPPAAREWARIPSWTWHRAGVTPQRADTIMRALPLARHLERAATPGRADAAPALAAILLSVRGIGPWTVAETAQRAIGDPDAVSVGDFHLKNLVGHALHGRDMTDDEMLVALEPWAGHRYRVIRLIEKAPFDRPERHGPRLTIPEHRTQ